MSTIDLHEVLSGKWTDGTRPKDLYAAHVSKAPEAFLPALVSGLDATAKRLQDGCAELCSLLSADRPELLAPHAERFLKNLHAEAPVLRWEAACTVGNLAAVEKARAKIVREVDALIDLLSHESIVLQGHAARALGKIGRAEPKVAPAILEALFAAAGHFPGTRVGYLVEAAGLLSETANDALAARIRSSVAPYVETEERPVATKAKKVLRALDRRAVTPARAASPSRRRTAAR